MTGIRSSHLVVARANHFEVLDGLAMGGDARLFRAALHLLFDDKRVFACAYGVCLAPGCASWLVYAATVTSS